MFRQGSPAKRDGSHSEAFWFEPVRAITASVQPDSGRRVNAGSDFPHPFEFLFVVVVVVVVLPKKARIILCKTCSGPTRTGWDPGGMRIASGKSTGEMGSGWDANRIRQVCWGNGIRVGCESDPANQLGKWLTLLRTFNLI